MCFDFTYTYGDSDLLFFLTVEKEIRGINIKRSDLSWE